MTIINTIVSETPGSGIANLLPSQQRLSWERQWLSENKSSFNVVKGDMKSISDQRAGLQFRQDQKLAFGSIAIDQYTQPCAYATSDESIGTDDIATDKAISVLDPATDAIQGSFEPEAPMLLVNRQEAYTPSAVLAADVDKLYRRQELRQSAVWRDGKSVAVSMRLPKQLQDDQVIFSILRHWLADAGLKLQSLIVNGKLR